MVLELLFLALLIAGLCALAYRSATHEFQILQKDFTNDNNWSELLSEELPLVVRGVPKSWLGTWSERSTAKKTWQVVVKQDDRRFKTTWATWLTTPYPKPQPQNIAEISAVARLDYSLSNWTADGFRRWSWLPTGAPSPYVFGPQDWKGVQKTTAEFTAVVATDGAALEIWIAHEGAIPTNVSTDLVGKNPWEQTTEDIPWIGEVKFIEIKLRAGNALVVPKHWWLAVRHAGGDGAAWFWTAEFQTPVSWVAGRLRGPF